jgi:hypothetical protein
MYDTSTLDFLPLWGVFLASALLMVAAIELGYKMGKKKLARLSEDAIPHLGGAVAASLGLLAFMLAFTFGVGTDRWDKKTSAILEESNAIGTAYLRTDFLPEPFRSNSRRILVEYVDHHLTTRDTTRELRKKSNPVEAEITIRDTVAKIKGYHDELWAEAVAVAALHPTPITSLFAQAVNDLIDLQQVRITLGVQQRMPRVYWVVLLSLTLLAMWMVGYDAGLSRSMRSGSVWTFSFAFATVISLVVALDRPGIANPKEYPLMQLQEDMHKSLEAVKQARSERP